MKKAEETQKEIVEGRVKVKEIISATIQQMDIFNRITS